jgi:hypothetical protein
MGGVGFADGGRSLNQTAGGATAVGISSAKATAAKADGVTTVQRSAVEHCWAGQ